MIIWAWALHFYTTYICSDKADEKFWKRSDDHQSLSSLIISPTAVLMLRCIRPVKWLNSRLQLCSIAIYLVTLIIQQMHKPCHIWPTVNSRFQPNARLGEILFSKYLPCLCWIDTCNPLQENPTWENTFIVFAENSEGIFVLRLVVHLGQLIF